MRISQVNVTYPGGSTGKIADDIHQHLLSNGHESFIYYGRGGKVTEKNVFKTAPEGIMKLQSLRSRITGYTYGGCLYSTHQLIRRLNKDKPDLVHLHVLNGYFVSIYRLLEYLKRNHVSTVLTLHAELMYTGGCSYSLDCNQFLVECCANGQKCPQFNKLRPRVWFFDRVNAEWKRMNGAFRGFDNIVVCPVSDWVKHRASKSPFMKGKRLVTVMNGLNTDVFKIRESDHLRAKHKIGSDRIVLHVTPNFMQPIKGGRYVVELAEKLKGLPIKVVIVGFNGNASKLPDNVVPVARTADQHELAAYYSMADVTLLTSLKETFSMIVAESLCCGTPVVAFEAGAPETIAIPEYCSFVEQGDVDGLIAPILSMIESGFHRETIAAIAAEKYSAKRMCEHYYSVYTEVLGGRSK